MMYESTRGGVAPVTAAEAIKLGIAPDGGLFVPVGIPEVSLEALGAMTGWSYRERASFILRLFLSDYTEDEISQCVADAYNERAFDHPAVAPLYHLDERVSVLELWHGPTSAFKDMALQILPHLLTRAAAKTGDTGTIVILVATSGDTGKAALEGFKDVPQTRIIVFYPQDGVSLVQKLQMVTQEGGNVDVVAVCGNFDDAQNGVKEIFGDSGLAGELDKRAYRLSSANSINWGRLAPQIVYYYSAYLDLLAEKRITLGEKINFVVPTGNFGNILAAYYAKEMGLPVNRLICASNANNVLTDFIRTGEYKSDRHFWKTISPSMDILISSNLERLLYHLNGRQAGKTREWMGALQDRALYQIDPETLAGISRLFWPGCADDRATLHTINAVYQEYRYVMDTHTGVGFNVYEQYRRETGDTTKTVVASTASPFKFNTSVTQAILGAEQIEGKDEIELLEVLSRTSGLDIPAGLRGIDAKPVRHMRSTDKGRLMEQVREILGI